MTTKLSIETPVYGGELKYNFGDVKLMGLLQPSPTSATTPTS